MKATNTVNGGPAALKLRNIKWCTAKEGICNANFYSRVSKGLCTNPVKIGARGSRWPEHEIEALVAARVAGRTDAEIRALVQTLHAKRQTDFAALTGASL